ncbi:MAG: Omp28-related outer membrane protein [Paludibacteraceae bacterium]|nr:Omp28-related outer membrane protein [Paludibacteraceae bacterium]
MRKTILFVALLCGVLLVSAQNTIDTTNQAILKYCSDEILSAAGNDKSQVEYAQSAAIKFTSSQLRLYKGNYVVKMAVGLAKDKEWTPESVSSLKFWIRKTLKGDNLWEQDYDVEKIVFGEWNELVFDEFFSIDAFSDLYFGYTINCGGLPIGGDGNNLSPNSNATYIYDVDGDKWISYKNCGNWSIRITISGDNMPSYNLAMNALRTVEFARTDSKFDAIANISNTTDKEVTSFDFVVYKGAEDVYRKTVLLSDVMNGAEKPQPVNVLKNGESANVFIEGIQFAEEGVYDVTYTIENINGNDKDDNEVDSKIVKQTYVSNEFENKVVMLEMFSGTMCSNCPAGHNYLHHAIDELGVENYVWAIHHAGYNASELTVDESSNAVAFYGASMTYAPGVMLDRINLLNVGVTSSNGADGPVFSVNEVGKRKALESYMTLIQKNMSPVALDVYFTLNEATRELEVTVEGELLGDFTAQNLRVGVITIEDSIKGTQAGVSGKYKHTHIIRSFMTSAFGETVTLSDGAFYKDFSQTLKDKFVLDNMRLAVWVGRNASEANINGFEIYQAYEVKLTDRPYTAVEFVSDDTQLVVYQEGEYLYVKGIAGGDVLSVYTMEGKLAMQQTADADAAQIDLSGLTKGAYLLQTNGSYVKFVK